MCVCVCLRVCVCACVCVCVWTLRDRKRPEISAVAFIISATHTSKRSYLLDWLAVKFREGADECVDVGKERKRHKSEKQNSGGDPEIGSWRKYTNSSFSFAQSWAECVRVTWTSCSQSTVGVNNLIGHTGQVPPKYLDRMHYSKSMKVAGDSYFVTDPQWQLCSSVQGKAFLSHSFSLRRHLVITSKNPQLHILHYWSKVWYAYTSVHDQIPAKWMTIPSASAVLSKFDCNKTVNRKCLKQFSPLLRHLW